MRKLRKSSRPNGARHGRDGGTPWDPAARWYDALVGADGSAYQKDILMPESLRLLDVKPGQRVLDLACGQGVFSRYLSKAGMRVVGLDSSRELIQFAGKRSSGGMQFHVGDAGAPEVLKGEMFDRVVCLMAVQNMEDIEPVFRNVAGWIGSKGNFLFVITHPCFRIPRQTHWGWDEEKKIEYRRVDHYATESRIPILTPPMARSEHYTFTYHRPLARYFEILGEAGLCVDRLEEWISNKESRPGPRAKAENRARREIPLFMAIRARALSPR